MFNLPTKGNGAGRFTMPAQSSRDPEPATQQALQAATDTAKSVLDRTGKFIAEHPGASLAAAVTCGVLLGWFIKRTK